MRRTNSVVASHCNNVARQCAVLAFRGAVFRRTRPSARSQTDSDMKKNCEPIIFCSVKIDPFGATGRKGGGVSDLGRFHF